ncbi:MAG: tetratricopeptide repeat protein [Saprospiraceae bacterium]
MKNLILTFLLLNISLSIAAQVNSDSLWSVWSDETQPVVTRLEALQSMGEDKYGKPVQTIHPDTVLYRAQLMYDLAKTNDLKKWMGEAFKAQGNYFLRKNDFAKAIEYFIQGKAIGEELGDKKLVAKNSYNIGICYLKSKDFNNGLPAFIQAAELFQLTGDKKLEAMALSRLAEMYMFVKEEKTTEDVKIALEYLEKALAIREELIKVDDNFRNRFVINGMKQTIKNLKGQLKDVTKTADPNTQNSKENKVELLPSNDPIHLESLGNAALQKGENDKALEYFFKGLKKSEAIDNKALIASSLKNIGNVYRKQGNINKALDYLIQSRKVFKEIENGLEVATLQNIIATIYSGQGDQKEALNIFSENLAYYKKVGSKEGIAATLANIGSIYLQQGDLTKALENYKVALEILEKRGLMQGVATASINIGGIYDQQGNFPLALEYLTKGLNISKNFRYQENIALAESAIASVYAKQGIDTEALSVGTNALALAQETGNIRQIMQTAFSLGVSYKANDQYKEALEMNELYFQMRDSLISEENQKAVIQLQVQSDYEKQKAIDDLENEKRVAIETQKKENQQKLSIAIGIGLLLISFLALVIFNRLKVTRQQKAIIEEQKKKVEQSEKYKEQFLANMSHEIRTPMHAISGMVKILERNEHPPSQDVFLHAMKTSSDNLVVILNDVLDLSKIEAGKLDIESIPTSPAAVIENVTQILKYKAEEKGLQLNYQIDEEVPDLIMGDPTRLNQILINLAGNAIKFTEKGNVNILLQKENDRLKFSVKDTGIGIPKEKIEKIFGAFEQAKDSTTRSYGGTGLGLSISKQLVELQSGKIWAESEEGQGSTFFIELPLVIAASNAINEGIITEDKLKKMTTSLEGIRVLLAEDNPFNQMIAQDDLSFFIKNIKIDVVENGALAVEKFKTGNYDLILMDVQMPVMNGFEATRKIREIEKSEGKETAIPIIAMTASLLKSEVDNCYDSGMNNYIPKPYKSEELIAPIFSELNKN